MAFDSLSQVSYLEYLSALGSSHGIRAFKNFHCTAKNKGIPTRDHSNRVEPRLYNYGAVLFGTASYEARGGCDGWWRGRRPWVIFRGSLHTRVEPVLAVGMIWKAGLCQLAHIPLASISSSTTIPPSSLFVIPRIKITYPRSFYTCGLYKSNVNERKRRKEFKRGEKGR